MSRLKKIKEMLIASFEPALKSVREAVAQTNRDNMFLLVVNFLGGEKLQNVNSSVDNVKLSKVFAQWHPQPVES